MKIKFLNIITILSLSLNADIIISADNLPNVSKEFLQHNFKAPIGIVQKTKIPMKSILAMEQSLNLI